MLLWRLIIFVHHAKGPGLHLQCMCRHGTNPKKGDLQEGRYCWPEFGGQPCWAAWRCPGQARMAAGGGRAKEPRHTDTKTHKHKDTKTHKQALKRGQTNTHAFTHRHNDTRHNTHRHKIQGVFFWFLKLISVCWALGFKLNWFSTIVDWGKDLGH